MKKKVITIKEVRVNLFDQSFYSSFFLTGYNGGKNEWKDKAHDQWDEKGESGHKDHDKGHKQKE